MDRVPFDTKVCSRLLQYLLIFWSLAVLISCSDRDFGFALTSEGESFQQAGAEFNAKVDIIWMVDGSNTMENHQNNLANNFGAFITEFSSKGLDYRMVVASTDAWVREVDYNGGACTSNPNPSRSPNTMYVSSADCKSTLARYGDLASFRDGDVYGSDTGLAGQRSGVYLLGSQMNVAQVQSLFSTNVRVGTRGDGTRESAFQSLRSVLRRAEDGSRAYGSETHTVLNDFRRPDAFLAVIIVSDEEDQGRRANGTSYSGVDDYVNSFKTFMNGYTGNRNYSISSIVIDDLKKCSYDINQQATQGDRYVAVAAATGGVSGSICSSDFSAKLQEIAQKVVNLLTRFPLSREPNVKTITVKVNGVSVPQSATDGWTYGSEEGRYFLSFHGSAVPPQGAQIQVNYTPASAK